MVTFYSHRKLADQVYIETAGVEYDDFEEGAVFEHRPGRTLSAEENRLHAVRSADLSMRAVDAVYNEKVHGGQNVISETLVLSVVTALTTKTFQQSGCELRVEEYSVPDPCSRR
jgi:itaconyl-CoA hydratase